MIDPIEAQQIARILKMYVLGVDSAGLISHGSTPLTDEQAKLFNELMDRASCEPVHRIIGFREFHGLKLTLQKDTLEPRDDSETLIDAVLHHLNGRQIEELRFADLGTGTGALALALLTELPNAFAVATDIAQGAVETAKHNAEIHELGERFETRLGSWSEPLSGRFHFIISNPPYIATDVLRSLDPRVRDHDPWAALDGGNDGLDAYRIIMKETKDYLEPDGFLALEIGYDQAASVRNLAIESHWTFQRMAVDLGNNDRALIFTP